MEMNEILLAARPAPGAAFERRPRLISGVGSQTASEIVKELAANRYVPVVA